MLRMVVQYRVTRTEVPVVQCNVAQVMKARTTGLTIKYTGSAGCLRSVFVVLREQPHTNVTSIQNMIEQSLHGYPHITR